MAVAPATTKLTSIRASSRRKKSFYVEDLLHFVGLLVSDRGLRVGASS
jgi:hypothetical protein